MAPRQRSRVVLCAPQDELDMLAEWLRAAGYEPVAADAAAAGTSGPIASLVRWPVADDLSGLCAPVIVLYEPGAELNALVGIVSEAIELPDQRDVHSLIAWSTMLSAVLRDAEQRAAPPPVAATPRSLDAAAKAREARPAGTEPPALIAI
ncbi:MAG TPA: hypothetical protein ENI87_12345, partial [bacterium]|nr:hypothetical protein [bacterium]